MSFVSIVATKDFVTVVSDGLAINLETGEVIENRYKKFFKISEKQFIAFAGNKGIADHIKEIINYKKEGYNLFQLISALYWQITREIPFERARVLVAVGGVNENGEIEFHTFINKPGETINSYRPKNDEITYSFLESKFIDEGKHQIIENKFIEYLSVNGYNTPYKVLRSQVQLNKLVCGMDPSVNNITFELYIRK
jgi:hypothetical protein